MASAMGIENSLAVDDAMKKLNNCKLMILPDRPPGTWNTQPHTPCTFGFHTFLTQQIVLCKCIAH